MKDKQIIENIKLLQLIKPDKETLSLIHKNSTAELFGERSYNTRKRFAYTSLIPFFAIAIILIIFSVVTVSLPNTIHKIMITTEIAFTPNHYEQAKIAVVDAENQFTFFKQRPTDSDKLIALSQSLALANMQMIKLQLVGEKGKYTMQDCLTLYSIYHNSLESMRKTVSLQSNLSYKAKQLLKEIEQYDEQAEKKLHLYKA